MAFDGCINLKIIDIPDSVVEIGTFAFSDCKGLESIDIPPRITHIRSGMFSSSGITHVQIPVGVTVIESFAFAECENLIKITIPVGVTSIGHHAFSDCSKLVSVIVPDSVIEIQPDTFENCNVLGIFEAVGMTNYPGVNMPVAFQVLKNQILLNTINFVLPKLDKFVLMTHLGEGIGENTSPGGSDVFKEMPGDIDLFSLWLENMIIGLNVNQLRLHLAKSYR